MASEGDGTHGLFRFLVDYRLWLYFAALFAMSLPLGLVWLYNIEISTAARTTIVAVSFAVILVTYLAERRVGLSHDTATADASGPAYPLRMRAGVVLAILGVAGGVFFALDGRPLVGLMFGVGAVFFLQMAYQSDNVGESE